jgi:hypothetical protein
MISMACDPGAKRFVSQSEMTPVDFTGFPPRRGPKRNGREIDGGSEFSSPLRGPCRAVSLTPPRGSTARRETAVLTDALSTRPTGRRKRHWFGDPAGQVTKLRRLGNGAASYWNRSKWTRKCRRQFAVAGKANRSGDGRIVREFDSCRDVARPGFRRRARRREPFPRLDGATAPGVH